MTIAAEGVKDLRGMQDVDFPTGFRTGQGLRGERRVAVRKTNLFRHLPADGIRFKFFPSGPKESTYSVVGE